MVIETFNLDIIYVLFYFSDDDCGNPMVAGYQADIDPDDFAPSVANAKVKYIFLNINLFKKENRLYCI